MLNVLSHVHQSCPESGRNLTLHFELHYVRFGCMSMAIKTKNICQNNMPERSSNGQNRVHHGNECTTEMDTQY